jgi:hypothetical protein
MRHSLAASLLCLSAAFAFAGCGSDTSSSSSDAASSTSTAETPATQPSRPIPPTSIFAKVRVGEGSDEVYATIGQPTSQSYYATGKAFIPFHYGGDNSRLAAHYKGVGIVTFSQNSAFSSGYSVMQVDYDPDEPGYAK